MSLSEQEYKDYIAALVDKARTAQKEFEKNYTNQRAIDEVVRIIGLAPVKAAQKICEDILSETGMGDLQSKLMKLNVVALNQWNQMKGLKSVGIFDCPDEPGVCYIPKPLGVIGCIMPSTNPIVTIISNGMAAIKCRNAVIVAPHPASAFVSQMAVDMIREDLAKIGAPQDIIQTISPEMASIAATNELLHQCDVNVATGGRAMVKAVYSSGRPAFGVGQGNCQAIIDTDVEDYGPLAGSIIFNRSWDQGIPCTGEQTVHVPENRLDDFLNIMQTFGAYVIKDDETVGKLRELIFPDGSTVMNRKAVGKLPHQVAEMIGLEIPETTPILLVKNQAWGDQDVLCLEILSPILRYTTYQTFEEAVDHAVATLNVEGAGHSSALWTNNEDHINYAANLFPVGRFHVNQPTIGGGSGIDSSSTIGCGSWGGNSISEYLCWYHLMNKTKVTRPVPNLRFPDPEKDWDDFEPYNKLQD